MEKQKAYFHLPGLFEFYELYSVFLPLYREHREYFYDWCEIASIYGAPAQCIWGGGRVGFGENNANDVISLLKDYQISARLTFSNSLLETDHLKDKYCNSLCDLFHRSTVNTGVILHSDLLLNYLKQKYPEFHFISSTTKVITDFNDLIKELDQDDFSYVVPDFRHNKDYERLNKLSDHEKSKIEFLCNECCYIGCKDRKECYENVSKKSLGMNCEDHICRSPGGENGYRFSAAMKNPAFIGIEAIENIYLPNGFRNFKIEGRSLGSAIVFEMLLYYLVKPEYQIAIREEVYLDSMLDIF